MLSGALKHIWQSFGRKIYTF